jgi:hypothetical protein
MKHSYLYTIQLVFILLFSHMALIAQIYYPFPTKNTVWTEYFYPGGGEYNTVYHNYALKDNDTIIHGKRYQKLYHSFDTIFTEDKVCGALREEDKRIYYYSIDSLISLNTPLPVDTEIILFDFNLKVGDTITDTQYRLRHERALIVAKIDSILIGTEFRKEYTFGFLNGHVIKTERWVEGVGCYRGLLSDIGANPTNDYNSWLVCFIQDGEVLFHSEQFPNCFNKNPNVVQIIENKSQIKIAPNPVGSIIRIELNNTKYQKLILTDQSGRNLRQYKLDGIQTLSIDRNILPDGVNFFSFYNKTGGIQTIKMLLKE